MDQIPETDGTTAARSAYASGRLTPQRSSIAAAAASMGAFTIEELAARVRRGQAPPGLATVYRAVRALVHAGSVERIGTRGSSDLYVWCEAQGHHHHVVCTGCGAVRDAACPLAEQPYLALESAGYTLVAHEMTLYGLCPACSGRGR